MLIMSIDADTGDTRKYSEGNLDAVDIAIASGGTLDMQAGSMKNFLLSSGKQVKLICPEWRCARIGAKTPTSSDLSATRMADFPVIHADGG